MFASPLRVVALAAASVGLSACSTYSGLGIGIGTGGYYDPYYSGYGYDRYGYDRYGYGSYPYGYDRYGYGGYNPYGSYYGWYGDFYYPGTGIYVYDRYRRPHRWSDQQRRYWTDRQRTFSSATRRNVRDLRDNWQDFRRDRRQDDRAFRVERREDRGELRRGTEPPQQGVAVAVPGIPLEQARAEERRGVELRRGDIRDGRPPQQERGGEPPGG